MLKIRELLDKELSFEEMNEWLGELMGYSCNNPGEDTTEVFRVYNDCGDSINFREYIGMKALNTLSGILLLKEKIDEARGDMWGKHELQQMIKKALNIE